MLNSLNPWKQENRYENKAVELLMEDYKYEHNKQLVAERHSFNIIILSLTIMFTVLGFTLTKFFDTAVTAKEQIKFENMGYFWQLFTVSSIVGLVLIAFFLIIAHQIVRISRKEQVKIKLEIEKLNKRKYFSYNKACKKNLRVNI